METVKNNKELLYEIALHEASHVVPHFFLKNLDDRFPTITSVIACLEENLSEVSYTMLGCAPEAFYTDKDKLRMKMINLLAGYCSYCIFIEETESFLSYVVKFRDDENVVIYHDINEILNTPDLIKRYSDIWKARNLLIDFCKNGKSLIDNLKYFIQETLEFLRDDKVMEAIQFVAKQLVNKPCIRIEGEELDNILQKVNTLLYE